MPETPKGQAVTGGKPPPSAGGPTSKPLISAAPVSTSIAIEGKPLISAAPVAMEEPNMVFDMAEPVLYDMTMEEPAIYDKTMDPVIYNMAEPVTYDTTMEPMRADGEFDTAMYPEPMLADGEIDW